MDPKTLASLAKAWRDRALVCDDEAKRFMDGTRERIANERYRDAYLQCAHDLEIVIHGGKPFDQSATY